MLRERYNTITLHEKMREAIKNRSVDLKLVGVWADEAEKIEEIMRLFMWATSGKFDEQEIGDIGDMISDARGRWMELRSILDK